MNKIWLLHFKIQKKGCDKVISFIFNDISSDDFGILVEESNHNIKQAKRIEFITVPGRTGDLIIYDNSRQNVELKLVCSMDITKNKADLLEEMDEWLNGSDGYKYLVFNNGRVFKAVFTGELYLPDTHFTYTDFELTFSAYEVTNYYLSVHTITNICLDGNEQMILNNKVDSKGETVTLSDLADGSMVDVICEGNTLVVDANGNEVEAGTEGAVLASVGESGIEIVSCTAPYRFGKGGELK